MKKFLSMALALAMAAALAVPAMADDSPKQLDNAAITAEGGGKAEIAVTAKVTSESGNDIIVNVYAAKITWMTTPGVYTMAGSNGDKYTWVPASKSYHKDTGAGESGSTAGTTTPAAVNITVENQSDKAIHAEATFAPANGSGRFATNVTTSADVATIVTNGTHNTDAYSGDYPTAPLGGALDFTPNAAGNSLSIGTVTVTITPKA